MNTTLFPGKQSSSTSFNLTAIGRQILKEQSINLGISQGDVLESVIRANVSKQFEIILFVKSLQRHTSPKGGKSSIFPGKDRGTTTAPLITLEAEQLLDLMARLAKVSRGDMVEYLLRTTIL